MTINRIKKIEEIELFERLVSELDYSCYLSGTRRDFEVERSFFDKVLYYLKLGFTSKDIQYKIDKRKEEQNKI
jgi:hypothetical protein